MSKKDFLEHINWDHNNNQLEVETLDEIKGIVKEFLSGMIDNNEFDYDYLKCKLELRCLSDHKLEIIRLVM